MDSLVEALGRPPLAAPSLVRGPWAGVLLVLPSSVACGGAGSVPASALLLGFGAPWVGAPRVRGPIGGSCVNLGMLTRWWVP